ncbi:MAG: acetyl-coenzyme A synthetase N-terminal domain-containing protein, partial [Pseudomonadota bacterium]
MDDRAPALYTASAEFVAQANVTPAGYVARYDASMADPDTFWAAEGRRIDWIKPFTKVKNSTFKLGEVSIKWYEDGTTNVSANCIDRHMVKRANQTAIIWEPDDPKPPPATS